MAKKEPAAPAPPSRRIPVARDEAALGKKAIQALTLLQSAMDLGDQCYQVRESEGLGWDGPRVKAWAEGCALAEEVLRHFRIVNQQTVDS